MKIILIDNYDSFTYNLAHLVRSLGAEVDVVRNDRFSLNELEAYDRILLSPGPGIPEEAGQLTDVIRTYAARKPMLGICLGEQAIGQVFGARLTNLAQVYHGVQTPVRLVRQPSQETPELAPDPLFSHLPERIQAGRYHSWMVDRNGFPADLAVTAVDDAGYVMALRHRVYPIHGIQFHPESILTPDGAAILRNWLEET